MGPFSGCTSALITHQIGYQKEFTKTVHLRHKGKVVKVKKYANMCSLFHLSSTNDPYSETLFIFLQYNPEFKKEKKKKEKNLLIVALKKISLRFNNRANMVSYTLQTLLSSFFE